MIAAMPNRPLTLAILAASLLAPPLVDLATGQSGPRPRPSAPARPARTIQIGGYVMAGGITFTAQESFDAVLGTSQGLIVGGGVRVGLPFGGLFVDLGAWRYRDHGERVFVSNGAVYPLNIPVEVTVTPIELAAGWQFRLRRVPKVTPYVAAGLTSLRYRETSDFATPTEDVDESFNGYHLTGGASVRIWRWLGAAGEVTWTTVPDAIGEGGVSAAFNEDDLGGSTFRIKITIGR